MKLFEEIQQANNRISPHIKKTELLHSSYLSELNRGAVYLKLENEQHTGSFKARGALNKVLSLSRKEKNSGLLTASTGNHALGFARALSISGDKGSIFLPENASPAKIEKLKEYGVELEFFGQDCLTTELHAKKVAEERGMIWVSPYNDPMVIAGQGTIGMEITAELDQMDTLLGCIGGGGMMSGVATWMKQHVQSIELIGCLPENSPEMFLSVKEGKVISIDQKETLSDGSAGGLEEGSITFSICKDLVDEYLLTSEPEIAYSIKIIHEKHLKIIEGAAGVAVAAFIKNPLRFKGKTVVIIICGGNISQEKLNAIL